MLEPTSRRLLMEAFQPPEGHRLDWAVGTTYSLNLMALLSAPVAFAFADCQDHDGKPVMDPLVLLKSVRQYADRVCLLCQAGRIQVPSAYQPLLANLENSIYEAVAPGGGSFHPKVWFLRYVSDEDVVTYRFLCLSRNLTFDRSWDTMLTLEGELRDRVKAFASNHALGEFIEALPKMASRKMSSVWRERLQQLAYEIRRVEFQIPEPFQEMAYWPIGHAAQETWPFPQNIQQMLVVSPFIDEGMLGDLLNEKVPIQLLSRPESLAEINPTKIGEFKNVWILDETAEQEPTDAEEPPDSEVEHESGGDNSNDEQFPLVGLHAKLYVADAGWNSHVYTGSANATRAAFQRNVEFLVELIGKRSRCGVDSILGTAQEGGRKAAKCLADLLHPFVPGDSVSKQDPEIDQFERLIEKLAKKLSEAQPVAYCEELETPESFRVNLLPEKRVTGIKAGDFKLRVRPISLPAAHLLALEIENQTWVSFSAVSLLGLTSFYVVEASTPDGSITRQFVLNIPLSNSPAARHQRVLNHLLSDSSKVMRFLLLLLLDHGARDFGRLLGETNGEKNAEFTVFGSMFDATLFESLMKAIDREPSRIDQVATLIEDLNQSTEGRQLLPADLETIWKPIWEVRQKQEERSTRG